MSNTIVSRMRIYEHQKTEAAKALLEALGFRVLRSSNSRHDLFWEVYDKDGLTFATTLLDNELRQLASEVLLFRDSEITRKQVDAYCQAHPERCYLGPINTNPLDPEDTPEEAMNAAREDFQGNARL